MTMNPDRMIRNDRGAYHSSALEQEAIDKSVAEEGNHYPEGFMEEIKKLRREQ